MGYTSLLFTLLTYLITVHSKQQLTYIVNALNGLLQHIWLIF